MQLFLAICLIFFGGLLLITAVADRERRKVPPDDTLPQALQCIRNQEATISLQAEVIETQKRTIDSMRESFTLKTSEKE